VKPRDARRDAYIEALERWNKKHRIIGSGRAVALIDESLAALSTSSLRVGDCLVDIGAGGGVLGVPWLWMNDTNQTIFVEPNKKKAAFLIEHLASSQLGYNKRFLVISEKFEQVPRQNISAFVKRRSVLASRAFSGTRALAEVIELSEFKGEEFFVFELLQGVPLLKSYAK
jgi:16S rRNA G527 N7-methylase RsmG